jgi:hypothetical protein
MAGKASVKVIKSSDLAADISRFQAQGYVELGRSKFQRMLDFGTSLEFSIANYPARQAKIVGAEVVLFKINDLGETIDSGVETQRKVDANTGEVTYEDYNHVVAFTTYEYVAVFLHRSTPTASVSGESLASPPSL